MNKNDRMLSHMIKNGAVTGLIAFISLYISIQQYYQSDVADILQRVLVRSIYTTTYLLVLWFANYLVVELIKIIYDTYQLQHPTKKKLDIATIVLFIVLGLSTFLACFLPLLFMVNILLLVVFLLIRTIHVKLK